MSKHLSQGITPRPRMNTTFWENFGSRTPPPVMHEREYTPSPCLSNHPKPYTKQKVIPGKIPAPPLRIYTPTGQAPCAGVKHTHTPDRGTLGNFWDTNRSNLPLTHSGGGKIYQTVGCAPMRKEFPRITHYLHDFPPRGNPWPNLVRSPLTPSPIGGDPCKN